DGHVAIDDSALHGLPARLLVALGGVDALHDHLALLGQHPGDPGLLAPVLAGDDHHPVAFMDASLDPGGFILAAHQSTSGASETILMNLRSRSSRATGPKMRVPRGWELASMITQAFSSKRM